MIVKEMLRKRLRNERNELGNDERDRCAESITLNCIKFLKQSPQVQHVHLFLPIKRLQEINTVPLLQKLLQLSYNVYSSVIVHNTRNMSTVRLTAETIYEMDIMGIPVPLSPEFVEDVSLIDVVFVPLLGVDILGNRIGYGQGFYDKFFKVLSSDVLKIGLSYRTPMLEELPHESHDVPLDGCVYPEGMVLFEKNN